MTDGLPRNALRDLALAVLLALGLGLAWTARDWADLSQLRLPDTDDAMRLQQIRDWIAGQPFADLAQHRLGVPPGLDMHWSRVPDLVPAALIAALTPILGGHTAELFTVIVWPLVLFAMALWLVGSIARRLDVPAPVAMIVAAIAYPATTIFVPGRIDHHGLQIVLLLALVFATLGPGTLRAGAIAGLATALSLAIGLETAPLLLVGVAVIVLQWTAARPGGEARLAAFGTVLALGLLAESVLLRTSGWAYPACDGFTETLWRGIRIASLAPLVLFIVGFGVRTTHGRIVVAVVLGGAAAGIAFAGAPSCLNPYGAVDPLLARLWLSQVAEAQSPFGAPVANTLGYMGVGLAGLVACSVIALRRRTSGWTILLAFQLGALAVTLAQLRGAYAGALFATPALAAMISIARERGAIALAGAWIAAAGTVYPLLASALPTSGPATMAQPIAMDCTNSAILDRLAALPPGRLLAPVDLGAFALAATRHQIIAAPYHRNNAGNRAMYDFFLSNAQRSEAIAHQWGIDYVAWCDGGLGAIDLKSGAAPDAPVRRTPDWLSPLPTSTGLHLYRVER